MNIEIGSKWVKDGEVVEVKALTSSILVEIVWYSKNDEKEHVITKDDFLEQYKSYEEPKQTVVIEKWLLTDGTLIDAVETSDIVQYLRNSKWKKVKLIGTYEIEL